MGGSARCGRLPGNLTHIASELTMNTGVPMLELSDRSDEGRCIHVGPENLLPEAFLFSPTGMPSNPHDAIHRGRILSRLPDYLRSECAEIAPGPVSEIHRDRLPGFAAVLRHRAGRSARASWKGKPDTRLPVRRLPSHFHDASGVLPVPFPTSARFHGAPSALSPAGPVQQNNNTDPRPRGSAEPLIR